MLRATVDAHPGSDVARVLHEIMEKAQLAGLPPASGQQLEAMLRNSLGTLVSQGVQLAAQGSQLNVSRRIEGQGFSILLRFRTRRQRGWLQRLFGS